jgi:hypothetical protein
MYQVEKDSRFTTEERLLYNIHEMMKDIHKALTEKPIANETPEPKEEQTETAIQETKPTGFKCKYCSEIHDNRSELTKCALKHKKKG